MAWNEKTVTVTVGADDALLLQGHLRQERSGFALNEVMLGMLDRLERVLQAAQDKARRESSLMGPDFEP